MELTLAIWSHKLAGLIIARWPLKVGFTVGIDVAPQADSGDFRAATPIMRTVGHCVPPFGYARAIFTSSSKANASARPGRGGVEEGGKRGGGKVGAAVLPLLIMRRINITTKNKLHTMHKTWTRLVLPRLNPPRVPLHSSWSGWLSVVVGVNVVVCWLFVCGIGMNPSSAQSKWAIDLNSAMSVLQLNWQRAAKWRHKKLEDGFEGITQSYEEDYNEIHLFKFLIYFYS